MHKKILVLGCTGSIGTSTLDIIRNQKDSFSVCGLSANTNKIKLSELSREFNCPYTLTAEDGYDGIKKLIEISKSISTSTEIDKSIYININNQKNQELNSEFYRN